MSDVEIVDLREELKQKNYSVFSRSLQNAIEDRLAKKEQILTRQKNGGFVSKRIKDIGKVIDVEITPECIALDLIDEGPGIPDVSLAMKEGYSTAPENVRQLGFGAGMGLPNIKKYTDEMVIDTEVGVGTTIHLKVYIK